MFKKIIAYLKKKYNECFFVGSTDKLPPPLSKEEELNYNINIKNLLVLGIATSLDAFAVATAFN